MDMFKISFSETVTDKDMSDSKISVSDKVSLNNLNNFSPISMSNNNNLEKQSQSDNGTTVGIDYGNPNA
jgi:hypothetical protein